MQTVTIICLCALLLLLLFLLVSTGYYLARKFIKHRELAKAAANSADIEVIRMFLYFPFLRLTGVLDIAG